MDAYHLIPYHFFLCSKRLFSGTLGILGVHSLSFCSNDEDHTLQLFSFSTLWPGYESGYFRQCLEYLITYFLNFVFQNDLGNAHQAGVIRLLNEKDLRLAVGNSGGDAQYQLRTGLQTHETKKLCPRLDQS